MTSPKTPLPRLPSTILDFGDSSGLSRLGKSGFNPSQSPQNETAYVFSGDQEKMSESNSTSEEELVEGPKPDVPIIYHYLEFETELPSPGPQDESSTSRGDAPEMPNLKKYQSPYEWSYLKKSILVWICTISTTLAAYSAGSYVYGVDQMAAQWHISEVAALVGITVYTAGFAIGPMFTAPFSELNGRRPMFVVSGILFVTCQACTAITQSYYGIILARFFCGLAASTFSTMVGGVISDMYHSENRNTPMAIYTGGVFFGTGLGPLVSGFLAQNLNWRWIFYVQIMTCGVVMTIVIVFFPESRGSIILRRKAAALNKWYEEREHAGYVGVTMLTEDGKSAVQRVRWKVRADEERPALRQMLTVSLFRPFHLLFTEPVVFFFSLWVSFSWAVLYMTFSAVPLIFETVYGFNLQQTGAIFTAICTVAILFTAISIYQDKLALRSGRLPNTPERRLYFPCAESILLPIGLLWLGWTIYPSVPWIVPVLGIAAATMGIMSVYLCVFNYLADTYHLYASSAIAAQSFCRNMLGGSFPLYTDQMFRAMGFHAALSLLGGVGLLLTLVPWVLLFYGVRIRARSKFASGAAKQ